MIGTIKKKKKLHLKKANFSRIVKVDPPHKKEVLTIRILILLGAIAMGTFLWWFIDLDHVGNIPLFALLTAALVFKLLRMIHEWYHYFSISVPVKPNLEKEIFGRYIYHRMPG